MPMAELLSLAAGVSTLQQAAWTEKTVTQRNGAAAELAAFLARFPVTAGGPYNLSSCTDFALACFLVHWIDSHAGGSPSPSYMQTTVSHLSTAFKLLGRTLLWNSHPAEQLCNPCTSYTVRTVVHGHARLQAAAGYEPVAATPVEPAKLQECLQHMWQQLYCLQGMDRLLMARDGCLLALALSHGRRAGNLCNLQWTDFAIDAGFQHKWSLYTDLAPGYALHMRMRDKTHVTGPCATMAITLIADAHPSHQAILWLSVYRRYLVSAAQPQCRFLFRTVKRPRTQLTDSALSAPALNKRLQHHMKVAKLPEKITVHSIRRGLAQHMQQQQVPIPAAMQVLGMASTATFARYSDTNAAVRHHYPTA